MARTIPGLGSLRTFEAAGRLLSFTKSAGELGVTPAAVSHQIRELEDQLGVRLFARTSRSMRLTHAGEILHDAVSEALDGIGRAVTRVRKSDGKPQLKITTSPSIAAKWLVPRLDRFLAIVTDADVRMEVSQQPLDFARDEVDIAIRFGDGNYPGLRVDRLFEETIFPVCSARLLQGKKALKTPRDLLQHNLIHVDWDAQGATWPNWRMWMLAAGIRDFDDRRGLHFSQTSLALQAAIDGHGVALSESSLVADDLAAGRLVQPFRVTIKGPPRFAYYVISPVETADEPMVRTFREWVLKEAAATVVHQAIEPAISAES
jgi:LysR family transcriptional regulator, glycine cleavage system transcriptional activator